MPKMVYALAVVVALVPARHEGLNGVNGRRDAGAAAVEAHVQGLQVPLRQVRRHMLCQQIGRILFAQDLAICDPARHSHLLDPEALSAEVPDLADSGPLRYAECSGRVAVHLALQVQAEVLGICRNCQCLGGGGDHCVELGLSRAQRHHSLLTTVRLDDMLADADGAARR